MPSPTLDLKGVIIWKGYLSVAKQERIVEDVNRICEEAPPIRPMTPWGKPMSVEMTSAGRYGWFTDRSGYRYIKEHPSGTPWPPIPESILTVWRSVAAVQRDPDCCLVNRYGERSRMGLHQDRDESDFSYPVISISLGDDAMFRVGGSERRDPTSSIWLQSGDVLALSGPARLAYHGIDRTRFRSSNLLADGGRINLTLRVVD